jgi:hypothetical protein
MLYCSPNAVLLTKYCLSDQIKKNEMDRAFSTYGRMKGMYRVLVGKPEGKRPLGRPRHSWGIILRWIYRKWDVGI